MVAEKVLRTCAAEAGLGEDRRKTLSAGTGWLLRRKGCLCRIWTLNRGCFVAERETAVWSDQGTSFRVCVAILRAWGPTEEDKLSQASDGMEEKCAVRSTCVDRAALITQQTLSEIDLASA